MNIKKEKTDVGCIIGRFQVDELHEAHKKLIQYVIDNHDRVILFLGLSPLRNTKNNPMDFQTRKRMMQEQYPDIEIFYINDVRYNDAWSEELDRQITNWLNPGQTVTLYGSRDSFLKAYTTNKFPTAELESDTIISGTDVRKQIMNKTGKTREWRAGIIHASGARLPAVIPTVDIIVLDKHQTDYLATKVLIARKKDERKYRFIGGKVDPEKDDNYEQAARRELSEETNRGMEVGAFTCLGSTKIDDWRYRREVDKIFTTLFVTEKMFGLPQPADDIFELKWVLQGDLFRDKKALIVEEHQVLVEMFEKFVTPIVNE